MSWHNCNVLLLLNEPSSFLSFLFPWSLCPPLRVSSKRIKAHFYVGRYLANLKLSKESMNSTHKSWKSVLCRKQIRYTHTACQGTQPCHPVLPPILLTGFVGITHTSESAVMSKPKETWELDHVTLAIRIPALILVHSSENLINVSMKNKGTINKLIESTWVMPSHIILLLAVITPETKSSLVLIKD